jgi:hypothetical protein
MRPRGLCLALLLVLACGDDDGTGDSATTVASTSAASTSEGPESSEAEVTGPPPECDAIMCGDAEICVVLGACADEPSSCVPVEMVLCDFGTGLCSLPDVCSGPAQPGALVCETCL